MITVWKKVSDVSWELVEEMADELLLAQRLEELRVDGSEYRAERKLPVGSCILDI